MTQYLAAMLAAARRDRSMVSVVMIDVDHFKKVNDTYGHLAGDQVLVALSRLLQQRLRRDSDVIGRYGGEEFMVLVQYLDTKQVRDVVDQLRQDFARLTFHAGDLSFCCSFSAGVASFPELSGGALLDAADSALYAAKRGGRNRVMMAVPEGSAGASGDEGGKATS
jgi:diguanylate cyclase (GGDEF)-like protein